MKYTPVETPLAIGGQRGIPVSDLAAAFATIPDPRRSPNTTYSVSALLLSATAAMLANHTSGIAIAEWVADQDGAMKQLFGFPTATTPHQTTFHRVFQKLDPTSVTTALKRYFDLTTSGEIRARGSQAISLDGKSLRGTLHTATSGTSTHILNAFCHDLQLVLTQAAIDSKENEISAAPALLSQLEWQGRVLVGDAMFCQREICQQIVAAGGDYLFGVKMNQPTLYTEIDIVFDPKLDGATPAQTTTATHATKGHGRIDVRHIQATADLVGYPDWPHLAQVVVIERTWLAKGQTHTARTYAVTSLPPDVADATRLLTLKRGHWGIENRVHYVCDVVFGEDASQTRTDHAPQVMARLRALALNLLHQGGYEQISARLRYNSRHPAAVLPLLGLSFPNA